MDYARICAGKFAAVADEWEAGCATIGKNVTVQMGARKIRGCAESLDDDGALLVRTEHGHLERIIGGDVTYGKMILLFDIGNTHTHVGLANGGGL